MKIQPINQQFFGARIKEIDAQTGFWEEISPANISKKKWEKVSNALSVIDKSLPNEVILLKRDTHYIAKSERTGLPIAKTNSAFTDWSGFVIKLAKKFEGQFVPMVKQMDKLKI